MEEITLTPQELEDIKDTIKFRECVMLKLKALNNIPKKVTVLETQMKVYIFLIGAIIIGLFSISWRVLIN